MSSKSIIFGGCTDLGVEFVERKGIGHPDTLSDILAERISCAYSKYTLEKYGVVLRHMVDKLMITGGEAHVEFGGGRMIKPVTIKLNGRFTRTYLDETIPYYDIALDVVKKTLAEVTPLLDTEHDMILVDQTHMSAGPGVVYSSDGTTKNIARHDFFNVNHEGDADYHNNFLRCNDTSTVAASYPPSPAESMAVRVEKHLNDPEFKKTHPYVGSDIKIMIFRNGNHLEMRACVPIVSKYTPDKAAYDKYLEIIEKEIRKVAQQDRIYKLSSIILNSRDDGDKDDLYMTLTGSAIESGDEGVVGRGNRHDGVISFMRPMSLEAPCGKNPVYHVGKIYTAVAKRVAKRIFDELGYEATVWISGGIGDPLSKPWRTAIELRNWQKTHAPMIQDDAQRILTEELERIGQTTLDIINGDLALY